MRFLLSLAWKNLSRYRRRTMITAAALAFGIAMFLWMDGWLQGAERESERNIIWYETGSAKVMTTEYLDDLNSMPLKHAIEDPEAVEQALEGAGVTTTRRTAFAGEIFYGEGSMYVKVIGIDPETDEDIYRLTETIAQGRYLESDGQEVVVGEWLAQDLGIEVGEEIVIRTRTRYGAFQTLDLIVVGILISPNPVINKGTAFIPLSLADEALEMEGAVTEITLFFPEWQDPELKVESLRATLSGFPGITVESWKELARDFLMMAQMKSAGSSIILFLVFVIAAVGISNTMLMAVYERVREIGMMRAMGMKDGSIRVAFFFEAGGIGLIGTVVGIVIGLAINWYMVTYGIDFTNLMGHMDIGYRVTGVFRSAWHPQAYIGGFIFGIVAAMVFSFIPSSRALKMEITDCLRYE
jgi:ABC-type lipoprotein release transport system permease subunit